MQRWEKLLSLERRPRVKITRVDLLGVYNLWVRRRQSSLGANQARRGLRSVHCHLRRRRSASEVFRSTDNVEGGTGPRAERRLSGRAARCGNRQGGGRSYVWSSLTPYMAERKVQRARCGSAAATATAAAAASAPASEKSKQKHARDYVNAGAELYRSRMLIRARTTRLSVRFLGLMSVCESWCSSGGWVDLCAHTAFSSGGRACRFCEIHRRASVGQANLDTVPRLMLRCATLFGHVQGWRREFLLARFYFFWGPFNLDAKICIQRALQIKWLKK